MKRVLGWVLILALCFTFVSCQDTAGVSSVESAVTEVSSEGSVVSTEPESSKETSITEPVEWDSVTPLLYHVTDEDGHVVWLFGSVHVGREDFYPFEAYLYNAYAGSDALAVEVDLVAYEQDTEMQIRTLTNYLYLDGTTIKDHLSEDVYTKAVEILTENGIYTPDFDYYCPAFWSSIIDNLTLAVAGIDASLGIDYNLIWDAKETEKELVEIESCEGQAKLHASFSDDIQELILASSIESYENPEAYLEDVNDLLDAWESGDEEILEIILANDTESMTAEEKELYKEFQEKLVVERNLNMAEFAEEALESGKETFICVGAAHIIGEGALVDLLTQRGYNVKLVEPDIFAKYK